MRTQSHRRRLVGVAGSIAAGIIVVCSATGAVGVSPTPTPSAHSSTQATASDREGPQFYGGAVLDVSGDVDGDVYAAGQSITISGHVTGDVIAAGQTITISGTVDGNVRLAAQNVIISGEVARSGTLLAESVVIREAGSFGDDVVGAAGDFGVVGEIGRDLFVSVGSLTVDGSIGGDLTYASSTEARIAEGAVDGTVDHVETPRSPAVEVSPWAAFVGWLVGLLYALVALSLVTLFAGLLVPRWLRRVTDHLVPSPWKALLVGFVASIAVPVALLFLLVTIVGAPLALAGILVWSVLTLATFVYGAFYIGRLLFRGRQHPAVSSLVGGLILIVALQIPWLNILVWTAMVCFGLGAQLLEFHRQRPWAAKADAGDGPPPLPAAQPHDVVAQDIAAGASS